MIILPPPQYPAFVSQPVLNFETVVVVAYTCLLKRDSFTERQGCSSHRTQGVAVSILSDRNDYLHVNFQHYSYEAAQLSTEKMPLQVSARTILREEEKTTLLNWLLKNALWERPPVFSPALRPWQTRTHCCGHIVADTNVFPFARARNICCGHKFCVRDTKNVSDFVQKHFVSATNVSQFAQHKKHHEQQCILVCQYL